MSEIPVGHHVILDCFDCRCGIELLERLTFGSFIWGEVEQKFNLLGRVMKQFDPVSYSIASLLSESHLSIHTWAERKFFSADLYTCTGEVPEDAVELLLKFYQPARVARVNIVRGTLQPIAWVHTTHERVQSPT